MVNKGVTEYKLLEVMIYIVLKAIMIFGNKINVFGLFNQDIIRNQIINTVYQ